jgi:hypothetical protein
MVAPATIPRFRSPLELSPPLPPPNDTYPNSAPSPSGTLVSTAGSVEYATP